MVKRGLVVLTASATRDKRGILVRRNLEAHFYFPYIEKQTIEKEVLQPIVEYHFRLVKTSRIGESPRIAVSVTRIIKKTLPPGTSIQDWWRLVKGKSPTPYAIYRGILIPFKPGDFRLGVLRFEIPKKIREKYNVQPSQKIRVKLPILSFVKRTIRTEIPTDTKLLVNNAFEVLNRWLDYYHYGKADVPVLSTSGSELDTNRTVKISSSLENKVIGTLGDTDFHLRVFDYDYNRVPISSDFEFKPDWFLTQKDVDETIKLAISNTIDSRGKRGRKPKPSTGQTTLTGGRVP